MSYETRTLQRDRKWSAYHQKKLGFLKKMYYLFFNNSHDFPNLSYVMASLRGFLVLHLLLKETALVYVTIIF